VTRESANISEFAVRAGGRRVGDFRADGVVAATPLGSAGYARAAGGPVVGAGTGLAVVPVAQFATARDAWVLDPPVACAVERDEEPVSLVLDGTVVGEAGVGRPVRVEAVDSLDLLVPVDGVESF
jgi:NAD+ kinase